MKLCLAAPASGLPSEPTALVAQASAMHFFMNEVFAAPASGLPSLPTALVSQESCANAEPAANVATMAAKKIFFMRALPEPAKFFDWNPKSWHDQARRGLLQTKYPFRCFLRAMLLTQNAPI